MGLDGVVSIDTAIALFRGVGQRDFRSTCTITRPGAGERVFDPDANAYTDPTPTSVYTGPCKVRRTDRSGNDTQAGEQTLRLQDLEVTLPADTAVAEGDVVTIDSSPDPALVDKTLRITDVLSDDQQVNRRCLVEEVVLR